MVRAKRRRQKKSKSATSTLNIKERLIEKRKAREARKKLIGLLIICLIIGIAIALPLGFIFNNFKLASGIAVGIPCIVFSYIYPRPALWVFLAYMCFSGTITYWIGGGNSLFQIAKDVFYLPALVALVQECRRQRKPIIVNSKIKLTFFILVALTLMTLFFVNGGQQFALPYCNDLSEYEKFLRAPDGSLILNPETGIIIRTPCKTGVPFLQGILGLKVFLGYIPLIFCAYYLIESKKQLVFLGRLLVVLAIVCCTLGIIQYLFLSVGICSGTRGASGNELFRATTEAKCLVGGSLLYSPSQGQIRLPGTFVSPWHWAWFLIANSFTTFTVAFSDTALFWRTAGLAGLALVFINSVICGQRIALALVPVCVVISLILTGQIANLKRFIPIGTLLALILGTVAIANPAIVQERVDSFVARWNTSPPHLFIQEQIHYAVRQQKGILGRGLGKATNSARVFGDTALVETYHPKILYEVGYPGLIAFLIFTTNIVIVTFKSYRSVKIPSIRSFGSSFWVFILIISFFPYWYPLDTDPVAVYYWFFTGVLLKLPKIDKQEKQNLSQNNVNSGNRKSRTFKRSSKIP
ncbi:MAG: hormogonium polysaccharide biosynthesis protein HpsL [Xenococcaceae cyanobacterium MO_234.B1]|nr:hormogonium polysaccharide biosynthesis protein HpsL [Xenococcaceae cyanobacterium MO_234.B1]